MNQFAIVIIKPDAVKMGLIGKIISRLEGKGIGIERMATAFIKKVDVRALYSHIRHLDNFENIVDFMSKGQSIIMIVCGEDAIAVIRKIMGSTFDAEAGTIRGDYAIKNSYGGNLVHCSDCEESTKRELSIVIDYFIKETLDDER